MNLTKTFDSKYDANLAIFGLLSGISKTRVAKWAGATSSSASDTLIKANPDRFDMFVEVDGKLMINFMKGRTLYINGQFVAGSLEVTGDESDGIIVCDSVYDGACAGDCNELGVPDNDVLEWYIEADEIGAIKPFKVGKVYVRRTVNSNADCDPKKLISANKAHQQKHTELSEIDKEWIYHWDGLPDPLDSWEAEVDEPDAPPEAVWLASNRSLSITLGETVYSADNSNPGFGKALEHLSKGEIDQAIAIVNPKRGLESYSAENISIENGKLWYKGLELKNGLTRRIIESMQSGQDFEFYLPFFNNLMLNPSRKAVDRLFDFLEANDIEITADGHFYAWKRVRANYTDVRTGSFNNAPGATVSMDRWMVDEDDERTCSSGLHVCSKSYLGSFGGERIVKVKVHPRDVVSIPVDYANAKMRTCKYKVIEDVTKQF